MKYQKIALGLAAATGMAFSGCQAQQMKESDVPPAVATAFQQKYPNAEEVEWEKESATEIEAEFEVDDEEMSATFSSDGTWRGTETEIKKKDLPDTVTSTLERDFAEYEVEEIEKVATPEYAEAYEVELEKDEITLEVVFDSSGKVLKQEATEEDEDGE